MIGRTYNFRNTKLASTLVTIASLSPCSAYINKIINEKKKKRNKKRKRRLNLQLNESNSPAVNVRRGKLAEDDTLAALTDHTLHQRVQSSSLCHHSCYHYLSFSIPFILMFGVEKIEERGNDRIQ